MSVKIDNPVHIDRIKLAETLNGKPVIQLYHGALKHPVLQLFQFHHLLTMDIDPNDLTKGETVVTSFNAHWTESEKTNGRGNAYKDVTHLEPLMTPTANAPLSASLDEVMQELAEIKGMLRYLMQLPAEEPAAQELEAEPEPAAADDSLADEFFSLKFANGGDVPEQHHAAFQAWQREHGKAPTPTEFYTSLKAK